MLIDPLLPVVFTRAEAVHLGLTRHAVTWRIRSGSWQPLRRGAFCTAQVYDAATAEQRHLLTAAAALAGSTRSEVISHLSAALAYGWPGPLDPAGDPWFTIDHDPSVPTRRRSGVVRQVAPLPAHHVRALRELGLTTPARTVADCLRHFPAPVSVPIADAAVRAGVALEEVARILTWQTSWPYAARGLASVRLVDGRRESWLESMSAVAHHRIGWPAAEPQVTIRDEHGRIVARVDFLWTGHGVIGEADGWAKYRPERQPAGAVAGPLDGPLDGTDGPLDGTDGPLDGADDLMSASAFRAEKVREDRLRDLGFELVRWTTAEALDPGRSLRLRLERAFARADPTRVRGTQQRAVPPPPGGPPPVELLRLRSLAPGGLMLPRPGPCSTSAGDIAS